MSDRSAGRDWRLEAELDVPDIRRTLHDLIGRVREPSIVKEIEAGMPHDVVVTHDGRLLFAYATDEAVLKATRSAIESVLQHDGIEANVRVSCWNDALNCWRQIAPPPTDQQKQLTAAADRGAQTVETRTLVAIRGSSSVRNSSIPCSVGRASSMWNARSSSIRTC